MCSSFRRLTEVPLAVHVTKAEYVVRIKWQPGDIAFWDNRATLHRLSNDYGDARKLQRILISQLGT